MSSKYILNFLLALVMPFTLIPGACGQASSKTELSAPAAKDSAASPVDTAWHTAAPIVPAKPLPGIVSGIILDQDGAQIKPDDYFFWGMDMNGKNYQAVTGPEGYYISLSGAALPVILAAKYGNSTFYTSVKDTSAGVELNIVFNLKGNGPMLDIQLSGNVAKAGDLLVNVTKDGSTTPMEFHKASGHFTAHVKTGQAPFAFSGTYKNAPAVEVISGFFPTPVAPATLDEYSTVGFTFVLR